MTDKSGRAFALLDDGLCPDANGVFTIEQARKLDASGRLVTVGVRQPDGSLVFDLWKPEQGGNHG